MTEQTNKAKLYAKIALIAGSVGSVAKDGYNPQLKYRYPTPATVIEAVKPLLVEHGLAIVPTITNVVKEPTGSKTQSGAEKVLTRVEMLYLILDGESGESLSVPWVGEGEDWSDKGIAKAQTIALRTFLLNLFQIPSGDDDPDAGQAQPRQPASYEKPDGKQFQSPGLKTEPTRAEMVTAIRRMWSTEKELGGTQPADELKFDLDDPDDAPDAVIRTLGRNVKARLAKLRETT